MSTVKNGDIVRIHYTGTLDDGAVFDSSRNRGEPLEIQMGKGQVIEGFEEALLGLSVNEKKTFTLDPEKAYGHRSEEATHDVPRADIPEGIDLKVGRIVEMQGPQGQRVPATIKQVTDDAVTLDLNHPFAGKSLTFDVEVTEIRDPSAGS